MIFVEVNTTHVLTTAGSLLISGKLTLNFTSSTALGLKNTLLFGGQGGLDLSSVSTPCLKDLEKCTLGLTISLRYVFYILSYIPLISFPNDHVPLFILFKDLSLPLFT